MKNQAKLRKRTSERRSALRIAQIESSETPAPDRELDPLREGVVLARLVGFKDQLPVVLIPGRAHPVTAAGICKLETAALGRCVALVFMNGDPEQPLVIGPVLSAPADAPEPTQRFELSAAEELILRCGKATLRLLADGSVILRGVNVVSRASAINRIRGGSVQIN